MGYNSLDSMLSYNDLHAHSTDGPLLDDQVFTSEVPRKVVELI